MSSSVKLGESWPWKIARFKSWLHLLGAVWTIYVTSLGRRSHLIGTVEGRGNICQALRVESET